MPHHKRSWIKRHRRSLKGWEGVSTVLLCLAFVIVMILWMTFLAKWRKP